MSSSLIQDAARIAGAAYLLALAVAAVFGAHRPLLQYPTRACYSLVRLCLLAITRGHLEMAPLARQAGRRSRKHLRGIRSRIEERRYARDERDNLDEDEDSSMAWETGDAHDEPEPPVIASSPWAATEATVAPVSDEPTTVEPPAPSAPPVLSVPPASAPGNGEGGESPPRPVPSAPWDATDDEDDFAPPSFRR
jgi:hypothetical protein